MSIAAWWASMRGAKAPTHLTATKLHRCDASRLCRGVDRGASSRNRFESGPCGAEVIAGLPQRQIRAANSFVAASGMHPPLATERHRGERDTIDPLLGTLPGARLPPQPPDARFGCNRQ